MSPTRVLSRRHLAPGSLLAGLALTGTALGLGAGHHHRAHAATGPVVAPAALAQAVANPSLVPAPLVSRRASRGAARTPLVYVPRTVALGRSVSGLASWYGGGFQGHRTADGERFDTNDLTAASRTLPFGTRLRVCRAGQCVVVRVNDRGPYVYGRMLDLSRAARDRLGSFGVAEVTATPIGTRRVAVRRAVAHPVKPTAPVPTDALPPVVLARAEQKAPAGTTGPDLALAAGGLLTAGALMTWLRALSS